MKTALLRSLVAGSLLAGAFFLPSCASEPDRDSQGRKLKLETVRRPWGPTTYHYRPVAE